jgi:hypothetical protein
VLSLSLLLTECSLIGIVIFLFWLALLQLICSAWLPLLAALKCCVMLAMVLCAAVNSVSSSCAEDIFCSWSLLQSAALQPAALQSAALQSAALQSAASINA